MTKSLAATSLNSKPAEALAAKKDKKAEKLAKKAEKQAVAPKDSKQNKKVDDTPNPGMIDLRVGLICKAEKHPDADSLYVSHIDVGEEKDRIVCSGLVKYIPLQEMQNRLVVCVCNLKEVKMRGILSQAMVLAASEHVEGDAEKEKVELVIPPVGAKVCNFEMCANNSLVQRFMFHHLRRPNQNLFFLLRRRFLRLCSQGLQHCRI
jgi:aminoacyl tRNA synthase complex-interacting multifunctional protein 1